MTGRDTESGGEPTEPVVVAAVDLGATSGRVMLGRVAGTSAGAAGSAGILELEEIARFPNEPVRREDGLHWDIAALREAVLDGLADACASASRAGERIASIGIDSWAVDYGVLRGGDLLVEPFHYRDGRNDHGVERVHATVPFEELYARNGCSSFRSTRSTSSRPTMRSPAPMRRPAPVRRPTKASCSSPICSRTG